MEIEPSEDTSDVLEVVEDSWEALDTKIDRSKAGKLVGLKKILQLFEKKLVEIRDNHDKSNCYARAEVDRRLQ